MIYPSGVRLYIDSRDITYLLFGVDSLTPTDDKAVWRNLNISDLVTVPGVHTLVIKCDSGSGRVDARVEING